MWILIAIVTLRCLYGDGSYYLLRVLEAGSFTEIVQARSYAAYLFQLPVVIALKAGVTSRQWLTVAFGAGCLSAWPAAMWLCHRLAPGRFWIVMLACGAGYLNAAFIAVGEHIVAHAFFWPALFVILYVRPLTPKSAACLLAAAALLTRSYESLLFLGPVLAMLTLWRLFRSGEKVWGRVVWGMALALFVAATWIALLAVLHPSNPANFGGFKHGFYDQLQHPPWTLEMSYFFGVLFLLVKFPQAEAVLLRPTGLVLIGLAVLLWGSWPLLAPGQLDPASQYDCRFLDLLVPLLLLPLAGLCSLKPEILAGKERTLIRLSAAMLIAQSFWHISATYQWHGYISSWKHLLATERGPLRLSRYYGGQTANAGQALGFDWFWANPTMSLMVGPSKVQALILPETPAAWQPFDPLNPRSLPHLEQYGIDYSAYVTSLMAQTGEAPK